VYFIKDPFGYLRSVLFLAETVLALFKLLKETRLGIVPNPNRTRPKEKASYKLEPSIGKMTGLNRLSNI
jgi:hypothetical protein